MYMQTIYAHELIQPYDKRTPWEELAAVEGESTKATYVNFEIESGEQRKASCQLIFDGGSYECCKPKLEFNQASQPELLTYYYKPTGKKTCAKQGKFWMCEKWADETVFTEVKEPIKKGCSGTAFDYQYMYMYVLVWCSGTHCYDSIFRLCWSVSFYQSQFY